MDASLKQWRLCFIRIYILGRVSRFVCRRRSWAIWLACRGSELMKLHRIEKTGIIKVDYGKITVLDIERLRSFQS